MLNDLIHFEVAIKLLGAAMYNINAATPSTTSSTV